jgi:hypothetical protein
MTLPPNNTTTSAPTPGAHRHRPMHSYIAPRRARPKQCENARSNPKRARTVPLLPEANANDATPIQSKLPHAWPTRWTGARRVAKVQNHIAAHSVDLLRSGKHPRAAHRIHRFMRSDRRASRDEQANRPRPSTRPPPPAIRARLRAAESHGNSVAEPLKRERHCQYRRAAGELITPARAPVFGIETISAWKRPALVRTPKG